MPHKPKNAIPYVEVPTWNDANMLIHQRLDDLANSLHTINERVVAMESLLVDKVDLTVPPGLGNSPDSLNYNDLFARVDHLEKVFLFIDVEKLPTPNFNTNRCDQPDSELSPARLITQPPDVEQIFGKTSRLHLCDLDVQPGIDHSSGEEDLASRDGNESFLDCADRNTCIEQIASEADVVAACTEESENGEKECHSRLDADSDDENQLLDNLSPEFRALALHMKATMEEVFERHSMNHA